MDAQKRKVSLPAQAMTKGSSKPKGVHVTQSAYRPMARPASRISQPSAPPGLLTLWSSSGAKKRAASESEMKPLRKPLSEKLLSLWSSSDVKKRATSESEVKPFRKGGKTEIVVSVAPKKEERKLDFWRKVEKKDQSMKSEGAISSKGKPSAGHLWSPSTPPKMKSEGASSTKGKPSAGHLWIPSIPPKMKSEGASSTKGKPLAGHLWIPSVPPKTKSDGASSTKGKPSASTPPQSKSEGAKEKLSAGQLLSPSIPPQSKSERASTSKGKPSAGQLLGPSLPPKSTSEVASSSKGKPSASPPPQSTSEGASTSKGKPSAGQSISEGASTSKGKPSAGQLLGPSVPPKSKSSVRRRPRQHRRSTGIVLEADDDDAVPEDLEQFVVRRSPDSTTHVTMATVHHDLYSQNGCETTTDIAQIRELIQEERGKNQRLQEDCSKVVTEMERYKTKVSELNRRCEDISRAYEQEKEGKQKRMVRLLELEREAKNEDEIRSENQMLKDENNSLLRVISKLSPIHK